MSKRAAVASALQKSLTDYIKTSEGDAGLNLIPIKKTKLTKPKTEFKVEKLQKEEPKSDDENDVKKIRKIEITPNELYGSWEEELEAEGKRVLEAAKGSNKYLGGHVSAAGGVYKAVYGAVSIGCRSFALFLKSQRRWESKAMTKKDIELWHEAIKKTNYDLNKIVPHGSYLMNAASPVVTLRDKTRDALIDEVNRCQKLGIKLYNFHPGSTTGKCTKEEGIEFIIDTLNQVYEKTKDVTICKRLV